MKTFDCYEETENYKTLTEFQKSVCYMLKEKGFKHKYFNTYQLNDSTMPVNLDKINNFRDLWETAYSNGATEKIWQIKRVLEVT